MFQALFSVGDIVTDAALSLECFCNVSNGAKPAFFLAVYHAIYLEELTATELIEKIAQLFNISPRQINQIFKQGPTGIHVLVSDEVRPWLFFYVYALI